MIFTILKTQDFRVVLSKLGILLFAVFFTTSTFSAPNKISDARWKAGMNHPGATSNLASSQKTVTTQLPAATSINSDYTMRFRLIMTAGSTLPVTILPTSHQNMIYCSTPIKPKSNQECLY